MPFMVMNLETPDYDEWKAMFDSDPAGRRTAAEGHTLFRSTDNPDEVFVRVEFGDVEQAKAFRERLLASGVLSRSTIKAGPTVVDLVENVTY
jgi:hypothetical protein